MNDFYVQLLRAAYQDPEQLATLLDQHTNLVTPEMAADLHEIYVDAMNANEWKVALAATQASAAVYQRLALPHEALKSAIDYYQIKFMIAQSADDYRVVRNDIYKIVLTTMGNGDQEYAFRSLVLAADCAFFAAEISGSAFLEQTALRCKLGLGDLVAASQWGSGVPNNIWLQRFTSLIGGLIEMVCYESALWEQPDTHLQLRQLAAATEALIPVDFEASYGPQTDSETGARVIRGTTISTAYFLAELSHEFGNKEVASARLDALIEKAGPANDLDRWISRVFRRHGAQRDRAKTSPDMQHLLLEKAEQLRRSFHSRAGRIWSVHALTPIFNAPLKRYLGQMQLPETLPFGQSNDNLTTASDVLRGFERLKARTLLDQLCMGLQEFADPRLYQQCLALERRVLGFEPLEVNNEVDKVVLSEIVLTSRLPAGDPFEMYGQDNLQSGDVERRKQMLSEIETVYEQQRAGFQGSASVVELPTVMQALGDDEVLIEYFVIDDLMDPFIVNIWAVVVTAKSARTIHAPILMERGDNESFFTTLSVDGQPVEGNPFQRLVVKLRLAIHDRNEELARTYLEQFYQTLIEPLEESGYHPQKFRRWIIVPHSILHHIPFAALINEQGTHLIEQIALTIAPSASIWSTLQRREARPITSFLGIANPVFAPSGVSELPGTEIEIHKICTSLQPLICETYLEEEATMKALQTHASGKSIIHIASHGDFPENDVIDFHRILLTPDEQHNGYVTAEDLRHMDFHTTRLLVLNICNGGLYRLGPGDEPYGLIASSLTAGVENIISTLWPIDDEMGHYFMNELYKHLLQVGPAEALRQASLTFIRDRASLNDWAGFLLIGTGRL